ncbi:MAG: thioredoxin-dependent thiol peroxidase [Nanoarchaeales archaeon]|nr:thioredoxin-dependent thiol peroxidase [Nanoarchaeales archaeon]
MIQVNDKALDFKASFLVDGEEKVMSLSDFKGKKIALYFYPKDMTPGCTWQAENLRDNYKELTSKSIVVIGVSKDPIKLHKRFTEKKELPFTLVSDEDLKVNNLYGVWQLKKFMGKEYMGTVRTTFLIDEKFKIINIINKVKTKDHSAQILYGFGL